MRRKAFKPLSSLLALCVMLTLLPGTVWAAEPISVTITPTGVRADTAINFDGYGSLKINGNWDDVEEWAFWDDDFLASLVNPQVALIDRSGKLLFPYRENADEFGRDKIYRYSDGIVSFTGGAYSFDNLPEYYRLDGTKAFPLEETEVEESGENWYRKVSTSYIGGDMIDGYALIAEMTSTEESSWSGSSSGGTAGTFPTYKIIDKSGAVICGELPEGLIDLFGEGPGGYITSDWVNDHGGEGLFAIFERKYDEESNEMSVGRGYIDTTGKTVIDLEGRGYINLGAFSSGLAWVVKKDGIGFIDRTGALAIPCVYESVGSFSSDGLSAVRKDGKYGYIDKTGSTVIPFEYDGAYGAGGGLATVVKNGKCGLVDYSNNVVLPLEYDDISSYEGGVAYAVKDGLLYIITDEASDSTDTPSVPAEAEQLTEPEQPAEPGAPATDAVLSPQKLTVDGKNIDCEKYNIGGSNYFKLRDLAYLLNNTGSQFGVGFDEATSTVSITTKMAYMPAGTELVIGADNSATAQTSAQSILIDGEAHSELTVYNIGGNNFFQLRELGTLLNFEVGYDADTNTAIVRSTQNQI